MAIVGRTIEVDVTISAAYDRWTRFEESMIFMDWVERVAQRRIAWTSAQDDRLDGAVELAPLRPSRTQVGLTMRIAPSEARDACGG